MTNAKGDSTNKKNVQDPNEENTMSDEQCEMLATEKGFGEAGAHRCHQGGKPGNEQAESGEWIEKQNKSKGPSRPSGNDYRLIKDE
jgi:hypothetical protein